MGYFKVGEKVVCIVRNKFWHDQNIREVFGPKYGEVLIIDFIYQGFNNKLKFRTYLGFNHYHTEGGYNANGFEKFDSVEVQRILKKQELEEESKVRIVEV